MHLGRNNPKFEYKINGVVISEAHEEKDLGVWIDCSMKPSLQSEVAAKGANQTLGLICRSFHYRTKSTLVPLFKTLVRPKLEFADAAWNPWLEKDVEAVEKVQRRLIRMLSNVRGVTYKEKLKDAGLTLLKDRRERGALIEAFKTINGFNNVNSSDWFDMPGPNPYRHSTRSTMNIEIDGSESNRTIILHERPRTESRNQSYRIRTARSWNSLPDNVSEQLVP